MVDERYGLGFVGKRDALQLLDRPCRAALVPELERSTGFDDASDVLIEGDSFEALQLLRTAGARVDMIYIDPPYNTGKDFVYRDDFSEPLTQYLQRSGQLDLGGAMMVSNPETRGRFHSAWLTMMYPRLVLARDVLAEEGLIFISIDDHEVHNLRLVMNEIFGEESFVAQVTLISNRGGRDYMPIAVTHEYLLVYGRDGSRRVRELPKGDGELPYRDSRGPYALRELRNRNPRFSPDNRPNLFYPFWIDTRTATANDEHAVALEALDGDALAVEPRNSRGEASVWRWGREKAAAAIAVDPEASDVVARRRRDGGWNVYEKHRKVTTKAKSVWDEKSMRSERGTHVVRELFGDMVFDHPKPVDLIVRCLQLGMDDDGVVLDFFAGSGTTAHAVMRLNRSDGGRRRCWSVQIPELTPEGSAARRAGFDTIAQLTRERIARAADSLWPEGEGPGLRAFRLRDLGTPASGATDLLWELVTRFGFGPDARCSKATGLERMWRVADPEGARTMVVCLEDHLDRATVERLDIPSGTRLVCLDDALDDELALNLCRRFTLETL